MMAEMPEIAADIGCTREELCAAVDAGADQADADRLNRAVWTLFERAMSTRLMHRRIDPLAARVIELEGEVERLRGELSDAAISMKSALDDTKVLKIAVAQDILRGGISCVRTALEAPNAK